METRLKKNIVLPELHANGNTSMCSLDGQSKVHQVNRRDMRGQFKHVQTHIKSMANENNEMEKKIEILENRLQTEVEKVVNLETQLREHENAYALQHSDAMKQMSMKYDSTVSENNQLKSLNLYLESRLQEQENSSQEYQEKVNELAKEIEFERKKTLSGQSKILKINSRLRKSQMENTRLDTEIKHLKGELESTKLLTVERAYFVESARETESSLLNDMGKLKRDSDQLQSEIDNLKKENVVLTANSETLLSQIERWKSMYHQECNTSVRLSDLSSGLQRRLEEQRISAQREKEREEEIIDDLKERISRMNHELKTCEGKLDSVVQENTELVKVNDDLSRKNDAFIKEHQCLSQEKDELEEKLKEVENKQYAESSNSFDEELSNTQNTNLVGYDTSEENEEQLANNENSPMHESRQADELRIENDNLKENIYRYSETVATLEKELQSSQAQTEELYQRIDELTQKCLQLEERLKDKGDTPTNESVSKRKEGTNQTTKNISSKLKEKSKQLQREQEQKKKLSEENQKLGADNAKIRVQMKITEERHSKLQVELQRLRGDIQKEQNDKSLVIRENIDLKSQSIEQQNKIVDLKNVLHDSEITLRETECLVQEKSSKIEELHTLLSAPREPEHGSQDLLELKKELNSACENAKNVERNKKKLETENRQLRSKLSKAQNDLKGSEERCRELKQKFDNASQSLRVQKERVHKLMSETNKHKPESHVDSEEPATGSKKRVGRTRDDAATISTLKETINELENNVKSLKMEKQSTSNTIQRLEKELVTSRRNKSQALEQVKELQSKCDKLAKVAKERETQLRQQSSSNEQSKQKLEQLETFQKEVREEMEQQKKQHEEETEILKSEVEAAETKALQFAGKFKQAQDKLKQISGQIENGKALYKKSKETIGQLNNERNQLMGTIKQLESVAESENDANAPVPLASKVKQILALQLIKKDAVG